METLRLLASSSSSGNSSYDDHHCEHGHSIFEAADYGLSITLFSAVFIILSIATVAIGKGSEWLENRVQEFHLYESLYHHVVNELMILGIIGFILTCVEIFGDLDLNTLHLVEIAHFVLLAFGLNYVLHTYVLYKLVKGVPSKYEKIQATIWSLAREDYDPMKSKMSSITRIGGKKLAEKLKLADPKALELFYLGEYFLNRRPDIEKRKFNFVLYIRRALEHEMLHLIHIKNSTWALGIATCLFAIAVENIFLATCGDNCQQREVLLFVFVMVGNVFVFTVSPTMIWEAHTVKQRIVEEERARKDAMELASQQKISLKKSVYWMRSSRNVRESFKDHQQEQQARKQQLNSVHDPKPTNRNSSSSSSSINSTRPIGERKHRGTITPMNVGETAVNLQVFGTMSGQRKSDTETSALKLWRCHHGMISNVVEVMLFFQCVYIGLFIMIFAREAYVLIPAGWNFFVIFLMLLPCVSFVFIFIPILLEPYFLAHAITGPDDFIDSVLAETIAAAHKDEMIIRSVRDGLQGLFEENANLKVSEAVTMAFRDLDIDGDGRVLPEELKTWMRKKGLYVSITDRHFKRLWSLIDEKHQGNITPDDFIRVILLGGSHSKYAQLMEEMKMGKSGRSSILSLVLKMPSQLQAQRQEIGSNRHSRKASHSQDKVWFEHKAGRGGGLKGNIKDIIGEEDLANTDLGLSPRNGKEIIAEEKEVELQPVTPVMGGESSIDGRRALTRLHVGQPKSNRAQSLSHIQAVSPRESKVERTI